MNDDELKALTPDLQALLDSERNVPGAPTAARERVRARLAVSVGMLGAVGAASAAGSTPALGTTALKAAPKLLNALWAKLAVGVVAAIGVGVGVHLSTRTPPVPAPLIAPAPLVAPRAPEVRTQPVAPLPTPNGMNVHSTRDPAVVPAPAAAAPVHHAARPSDDDLAAERALLEPARAALASGDPTRALAAVARHAQRFPRGQLVEEREALSVRALAASGQPELARARGLKFTARYPKSIFRPTVDATLHALP